MFCSQCGNQVATDARFCSSCGALCGTPNGPAHPGYYPPAGPLTRSRDVRVIAGVCGGLALHYGWDVTVVRLILVFCVLCAGTGVLAYIIAWIIIPEAPYALPAQSVGSPQSPS
jgi:phage shock protein C